MGTRFPYGTFVINLTACLIIGFSLTWMGRRTEINPAWRFLIPIGFVGAYSTFSTFEWETFTASANRRIPDWLPSMCRSAFCSGCLRCGWGSCWRGSPSDSSLRAITPRTTDSRWRSPGSPARNLRYSPTLFPTPAGCPHAAAEPSQVAARILSTCAWANNATWPPLLMARSITCCVRQLHARPARPEGRESPKWTSQAALCESPPWCAPRRFRNPIHAGSRQSAQHRHSRRYGRFPGHAAADWSAPG